MLSSLLPDSLLQWQKTALSIDECDVAWASPLGQGGTATIFYARKRSSTVIPQPSDLVLKVLKSSDKAVSVEESSRKQSEMLQNELRVLAGIQQHRNIISLYGICNVSPGADSPQWALQIEYCSGGDLVTATARERFPEDKAHAVASGVLQGLSHMHRLGFVHRDIKPENVLLTHDGAVKLVDFGIAAHVNDAQAMTKRCGSPGYVAPEVWLGKPYDTRIDSFATGALMYFVISGKVCFSGGDLQKVMQRTLGNAVNFRRSPRLERLSDACKAFIEALCTKDPEDRPTAAEAVKNMWTVCADDTPIQRKTDIFCEDEASGERFTTRSTRCEDSVEYGSSRSSYRSTGRSTAPMATNAFTSLEIERRSMSKQSQCNPIEEADCDAHEDLTLLTELEPRAPRQEAVRRRFCRTKNWLEKTKSQWGDKEQGVESNQESGSIGREILPQMPATPKNSKWNGRQSVSAPRVV
jgi:calcium/calmodulin-dependent protein kinase I